MPVQWTQDLSVGVSEIDSQHKELFIKVNNLLTAMGAGSGKEEVNKMVGFLGDYVVKHFGAEEKLMMLHGYPSANAHKLQHQAFIKEFLDIKAKISSGTASTAQLIDIQRRVCDWLKTHIGVTDRQLGQYIQSKN